jgi:hypothetical protein
MKRAIMLASAILFTGCNTTKDASRSTIEIDVDKLARTGKLEIQSPKDVDLRDIKVVKNGDDYEVSIGQYQAVVSKAAIESANAEIEANRSTIADVVSLIKLLAEKAAASQGVPQQPNSFVIPPGMKLVPRDDPSVPQPEIP